MSVTDSRYYGIATTPYTHHHYDEMGNPQQSPNNNELMSESHTTVYRMSTLKSTPTSVRRQRRANVTDTLSLVAYTYLKDPGKYWVVGELNPHIRHPFDIKVNDVINLPPT
jgi:hypothetical protein